MHLEEKQYKYLMSLLKDYKLNKNIQDITPLEASIVIEGILNNGKVKDTYRGKKLSQQDVRKKQLFFNNLASKKNKYATNNQLKYINDLLISSKYELTTTKIPIRDVNHIISFLKDNIENDVAKKYLIKKKAKTLIKEKSPKKQKIINLPNEWILREIELNGIVDFVK